MLGGQGHARFRKYPPYGGLSEYDCGLGSLGSAFMVRHWGGFGYSSPKA